MKRERDHRRHLTRIVLVVTGIVVLTAAILGTLLSTGAVDRMGDALVGDAAVLNPDGLELLRDHRAWWQLAALVAGVLLVAVGLSLVRWQLPPVRHQHDEELPNPDEGRPGRNLVSGGALARALEADLERAPSIDRAVVEVRPDEDRLWLRLDVDEEQPIDDLLEHGIEPALARFHAVAGPDRSTEVTLDLRPVARGGARVV